MLKLSNEELDELRLLCEEAADRSDEYPDEQEKLSALASKLCEYLYPTKPRNNDDNTEDEPLKTVLLWGVRGAPKEWFETKIQAEVRARVLFPIEDADARYARVFFKIFYTEEE